MSREVPAVFGSVFYPEMPVIAYENGAWQPVRWQNSAEITLPAGAHGLHYGSECFEGLKAFRQKNGDIVLFRPDDNIARMQQSARLLEIPVPETAAYRDALFELVRRAADIVPDAPNAMYLRPTLIGTDPVIGKAAHGTDSAVLYILASPVGDYFKVGSPMKLLVETQHQRCAPHMGRIKCGGNYASALGWTTAAHKKYGANQVLFCPNGDVQETGASNFMLIDGNTIRTKPLTDERDLTVAELQLAVENGAEAILTGTAAVISPVTSFVIDDKEIPVANQKHGLAIREAITAIQYGETPDRYGWIKKV